MNILITGGTTFVSKFTAEYFAAKGNDVTVINRGSRPQPDGAALINCDRTELGSTLEGKHFDVILDITAYTEEHVRKLVGSGVQFDDYIFVSSSAVYPETNAQPFTETQPCGRNSIWGDYGTNKLDAERYLQEHVPNAYILRPPYFYGVYENLYREAFPFDCAKNNRPFYLPQNGDMKLQFFNVSDLCRFIEIILEKHPENHIFNVGNKDIVTVKEWVELCYKAAGKTPEFISVDKSVPQRDYFCFYDYEYVLDVSLQNELMPDTLPLEQGLREEYEWYKNDPDSVYFRKPYMEYIDNNLVRSLSIDKLPVWEKLAKKIIWDQIGELKGKTLLDFGSGTGITADHFASDNDVTAIEPSEEMLSESVNVNGYRQITGSTEELKKFPDNSFDYIICHNVFEYAQGREETAKEFYRILKTGGNLSVVKHNRNGRVMQMAVLLNNFDEANSLLDGHDSSAVKFGTISYYEDSDISRWCSGFALKKTYGLRTFWDLQQNQEIQKDEQWQQKMIELEKRVSENPDFMNIAFFHHLIFEK